MSWLNSPLDVFTFCKNLPQRPAPAPHPKYVHPQFSRWFLPGECHVSLSRSHVLSLQNKQNDTDGTPDRSAVAHVSFDSGLLLLGRDIDRLRVSMIRSQVRGSLPCTGHQRGHRQNTMLHLQTPPPPALPPAISLNRCLILEL